MKICGSQRCGQLIGLSCFIATATLVAMAALHASGVLKGINAYKVAVGCAASALIPAVLGVILCNKKLPCSEAESFQEWYNDVRKQ